MDPLSDNPVVVSGSANFSDASTSENDENMIIIKGDTRVADIYYTEFMRLFNHYYFRSVYNSLKNSETQEQKEANVFIDPTPAWLEKYKPGTLRDKKIRAFAAMQGIVKAK
jgi:phosphatidylserine/phosphatidylglycerophosphate/cardiolipin synthase-like enzyme